MSSTMLGIVCMAAQVLMPTAVGKAVDTGIVGRDQRLLTLWTGVVVLLGVVGAVTSIMYDRWSLTASLGAGYRTLQLVNRHACDLGASMAKRSATGEVLNIGVADITQIGGSMELVGRVAGSAAAVVLACSIMVAASWQLGLIVLIGVPAMAWLTGLMLRPLSRRHSELRGQQARLTTRIVDLASGLRVVLGIGGEGYVADRYRAESQQVRRAGVRVAQLGAVLDMIRTLMPGLLTLAVVWVGAIYVVSGRLTPGQLVAFYGYAVFLAVPLARLGNAAGQLTAAHVAARRVVDILNTTPELPDVGTAEPPAETAMLHDPISGLTVPPGRMIAIVSPDPDDAVPVANRLGRYVDGGATYGDVPLESLPLAQVRRLILVAANDAWLFSGSLRTELDVLGLDGARPGSLRRAIRAASADDIFEARRDGLDGAIVGSGREFSGGEQQRLRLVRALMADPEVLVLLAPTSAVDVHTEGRIGRGLRAYRRGRTTVVFTSSPILASVADRVVLLADGKVAAEGTHQELLADVRYQDVVAREGGQ
ncbi:MAG TPA: ABC transporter ATP-binding protein [Micromonosporaceae bacterium]|nr:ABC transporter ATP-binding protein [Micromonosporaceae bacterium]